MLDTFPASLEESFCQATHRFPVQASTGDAPSHDEAHGNSRGAAVTVVGLGASSGGLEALNRFFQKVPPHSGLAFVIVQHLDPTHDSLLADILQRNTPLPVG